MPQPLANVPPVSCYVRKEYLRDLQDGHGEFTPAYWVTVKALRHRALYIEAFLPEYGALYDKLPISAFTKNPTSPTPDLPLGTLQLWDVGTNAISVVEKAFLKGMGCKFRDPKGAWHEGIYLFTVDLVEGDPNELDTGYSRLPAEHKSYNFIQLENGQYAAQPNNRILWDDEGLVFKQTKIPDFKVSTIEYSAEGERFSSLGDNDTWNYEEPKFITKAGDDDAAAEAMFTKPINPDPVTRIAKALKK
jgi:hypothetical protein